VIRQPVKSSQIHSVGFDVEKGVLEVQFLTGDVYRYADVPAETYKAFIEAQSIGRYFGLQIRGKFKFVKIGPTNLQEESSAAS
jgi:hypothetical protein